MTTTNTVITVSELNRRARLAIEKSLPSTWITGELSNLARLNSGHWYFTLKDEHCSVKCAFFRSRSQFVDWNPTEGDRVEIRAQATLYEARGDFQLIIDIMRRAGRGEVYEDFLRVKAKLESEGLFREDLKKKIPKIPTHLGIVTSLHASALHDVLKTLRDRWPSIKIIIYPATVQGTESSSTIIQAMNSAISRNECEVLLLVRGGGSLEDLSAFNDEQLARRITSSSIPIITGIGHETDFSIADFAADLRTSTPTAAAQSAVPEAEEFIAIIDSIRKRIKQHIQFLLNQRMQQVDSLFRHMTTPTKIVIHNRNGVEHLRSRLQSRKNHKFEMMFKVVENLTGRVVAHKPINHSLEKHIQYQEKALKNAFKSNLESYLTKLHTLTFGIIKLNPENLLSRGYFLVRTQEGTLIRNGKLMQLGQQISLQSSDCLAYATINRLDIS